MSFFKDSFFDDIHSSIFDDSFYNFQYPSFSFDPYLRPYALENQMANTFENMVLPPFVNGIKNDTTSTEDDDDDDEVMSDDKNDTSKINAINSFNTTEKARNNSNKMKLKRSNYPLNNNNNNNNDNNNSNMNINSNKWLNGGFPPYTNGLNPYEGWLKNYSKAKIFKPRMDITEETDHYIIHADLPGLTKDNVRMELTDNGILTISGERKWNYQTSSPIESQTNNNSMSSSSTPEESKSNDKYSRNTYYKRIERSFGQFKRSFTLPDDIDNGNIEAKMENGVLTIKLPKNLNNLTKKDVKLITIQ